MTASKLQKLKSIIQQANEEIALSVGDNVFLQYRYRDLALAETQILSSWQNMCEIWGVKFADISSSSIKRDVVTMKQIMLWYANRCFPAFPINRLSRLMNHAHNKTVRYATRAARNYHQAGDPLFTRFYNPVKSFFDELQ